MERQLRLMTLVLLYSMIGVMTMLITSSCTAKVGIEADLPFYGKWKVGESIDVGNAIIPVRIRSEEKRKMIGSIVEYTPIEVRYHGMVLRNPIYYAKLLKSEEEWPLPDIMDTEGDKPIGRVNYAILGFKSPVDVWYVEVMEKYKNGTMDLWTYREAPDDGTSPAEPVICFFVDAKGSTLVFYGDSGFYRAERVK